VNLQSSPFLSTLNYLPQGIGVNFPFFPDDTEVGAFETLTVNFSSGQFVHSISLRLLFGGRDEQEQRIYSINGGAFVPFFANSDSGDLTLVIDQAATVTAEFDGNRRLL